MTKYAKKLVRNNVAWSVHQLNQGTSENWCDLVW